MHVLVAAGEADLRLALELLLGLEPGVVAVGSASETEGLLALIRTTQPDLVVLDWDLPGRDVETVLSEVVGTDQHPHVIVLGSRHRLRQQVLDAGADAYVIKGEPPDRLLTAVRAVQARK